MARDLTIDFTNIDSDGLTHASMRDARDPGRVICGEHVIVGDDDAAPAVARVVEVNPGNGIVLLRVLPGAAAEHLHLIDPKRIAI